MKRLFSKSSYDKAYNVHKVYVIGNLSACVEYYHFSRFIKLDLKEINILFSEQDEDELDLSFSEKLFDFANKKNIL